MKAGGLVAKWKGLGWCRLGLGSESRVLTRDRVSGDAEGTCGEVGFVSVLDGADGEIGDLFWAADSGL